MTIKQAYEYMYWDLITNRQVVSLVPATKGDRAKNGCCCRAVESRNPQWYMDFCDNFLDHRGKTYIKRQYTLQILTRLKNGVPCKSKYVPYFEDIAKEILEDMNVSDADMDYYIEFGEFPIPFDDQF